jgi:hypothetical protein
VDPLPKNQASFSDKMAERVVKFISISLNKEMDEEEHRQRA